MSPAGLLDFHLGRRLLGQVRPYWRAILGILLLDLLGGALLLLLPLPLQLTVDCVLGARPLPHGLDWLVPSALAHAPSALLALLAAALVVITVGHRLQELASSLLRLSTSEKLVLDLRAQLFRHAQRLSLAYHDRKGTADAAYRIQSDAAAVQYVVIDGIIPIITASLTLVAMLYIALRLDWQLALVALTIAPVLFVLSAMYRKRLRHQAREVKHLESSVFSVVQEVLGALRIVKAFGQEEREQQRYLDQSRESIVARLRLGRAEGIYGLLIGLTTVAGTALVLFIGAGHVLAGTLLLGELLMMMAYLAQLYEPLKTLSRKATSLQAHFASAERAFALLDEMPDVAERPGARPLSRAVGAVALRQVAFAYEKGHPVLHDVSFAVEPGMRVGIVGTTGAGKTTLVSLLTRFYDAEAGQLLLDGVDVRDYRLADLRNQFAFVLQEPVLFSTSIAENIAYARPEASEAEIIAAARAASAHEFITSLPVGYQTPVGERGLCLSGGERQRIGLARAFLRDAPLLILDEPTSSVDVRTEGCILDALERLMHGRTTFMIAHRLGTLRHCDLLVVLEQGRVVEVRSDVAAALQERQPGGEQPSVVCGVPADA